jgi:peptide/nickel transport system substrate-binding protein
MSCSKRVVHRIPVVLLLIAVSGLPAYPASTGTQIIVAQGADIVTGDPRQGDTGVDYSVYFQMCDPLVTYDKNWNIVPALASSWKTVNPTTYEFKLRPGAKFQDGTPVTASDVKATMDRILDPAFKSDVASDYIEVVKSTDAVDATTVRFNLKVPYAGFLYQMPYIFPVSQQAVQKLGDQEFGHRPVCAGAYRLAEWVPDDHLSLERFDGYWGVRPSVDRIVVKPIPNGATRAAALRSGEIDLAVNLPPDELQAVRQNPRLKILAKETGRMEFFLLDTRSVPFQDKRVRQAVNYAVDWPAIIQSIMGGYGKRAPAPAMPYMFGYKAVAGYTYDPAKAKQLLSEAGYSNGFDLTVDSPSGRYFVDKEIAQAVIGYLGKVGIRATLQTHEWSQYFGMWRKGQWKMGLWGFVSQYHQFDDVGFHFEPSRGGQFYSDPDITKLFEEGRMTVDPAARKAIYGRLEDRLVAEAPWLFGVSVIGTYGANTRLQWEPRSGSDILFDLAAARVQ